MLFWIKFAVKNVWRNKNRTILTLVPIIFGVFLFIISQSLLEGLNKESIENLINYETSSLKIVSKNFSIDEKRIDINDITFIVPEPVIDFLKNSSFVESFTYEIFFMGNLSDGLNRFPVIVKGIDFKTYKNTYLTFHNSYPRVENFKEGETFIGDEILRYLQVPPDSFFVVQSRTGSGTFDAFDVKYSGIISTGNPKVDRNTIFIDLNQARSFLNMPEKVSAVSIKLKKDISLYKFLKSFKQVISKYPQLKLVTWEDFTTEIKAIDSAKKSSSSILIFVILLIGAVGIANTIFLSIYERFKEIGTMRSIGTPNKIILLIFTLEGATIGFLGSLIGMFLGGLGSYYLYKVGIDFSSMIGNMDIGYPKNSLFRSDFNIFLILKAGFLGILFGILASFYPARRAVKENIIRIMK